MKISSSDINILISALNSMYAKKMSPKADGPNSQTVYEVTINEILTESGHQFHYGVVIMDTIASQITSLAIVFSTVYLDIYQRKHQSSTSLAFVWGIHRGPVNSPHKWPVTRKMFPFDDVIMFHVRAVRNFENSDELLNRLSKWPSGQ